MQKVHGYLNDVLIKGHEMEYITLCFYAHKWRVIFEDDRIIVKCDSAAVVFPGC